MLLVKLPTQQNLTRLRALVKTRQKLKPLLEERISVKYLLTQFRALVSRPDQDHCKCDDAGYYCRLRTVRGEKVLRRMRDEGPLYYISAISGKRLKMGSARNG